MWTFIGIATAVAAVVLAGSWYRERRARQAFEATLTAEEAERMVGFCAAGHPWRHYRDFLKIDRAGDAAERARLAQLR